MQRLLPILFVWTLLCLLPQGGWSQDVDTPTTTDFVLTYDQPTVGMLKATSGPWGSTVDHPSGSRIAQGTEITFTYLPVGAMEVDYWTINGTRKERSNSSFLKNETTITMDQDTHVTVVPKEGEGTLITLEAPEGSSISAGYGNPRVEVHSGDKVPRGTFLTVSAQITDQSKQLDYYEVDGERKDPVYGATISVRCDKESITIKLILKEAPKMYNVKAGKIDYLMGRMEIKYIDPKYGFESSIFSSGKDLPSGTVLNCSATPNEGYKVDQWLVNDQPVSNTSLITEEGKKYTHTITSDAVIRVTFKRDESIPITKVPIHFSQPEHGSLISYYYYDGKRNELNDGDEVQTGIFVNFRLTPDEGYEIDKWIVNGVDKAASTSDTQRNTLMQYVDKETTVQVLVKPREARTQRTITLTLPDHATTLKAYKGRKTGSEIASGTTVDDGSTVVAVVAPEEGYVLDYWLVNNERVERNSYNWNRNEKEIVADKDLTISAVLKLSGILVTYTQPEHATLSVTYKKVGAQEEVAVENNSRIPEGVYLQASVTDIAAGWEFAHFLINGKETPSTFASEIKYYDKPTGDTDIQVVLKATKKNYKVKVRTQGIGGSVKASYLSESGNPMSIFASGRDVPEGSEVTCVATPEVNYVVDQWMINGTPVELSALSQDRNTYRFSVASESDVQVTFKRSETLVKHIIHIEQPEQGEITAYYYSDDNQTISVTDGDEVSAGTNITFTLHTTDDYELDHWVVNGEDIPASSMGGTHYSAKVTGDMTVSVVLKRKLQYFTLNYSGDTHGLVEARMADETQSMILSGSKVVEGAEIILIATPDKGYELDKWIFNGETQTLYTTPKIQLTMEQNMTITATFKQTGSIDAVLAHNLDYTLSNGEITCDIAEQISLYTLDGQLVAQSQGAHLDVRQLPNGRYLLVLYTAGGVARIKLLL